LLVTARKDQNDNRAWEELVTEAAQKRYLGYSDEKLGWKAPDLNGADPARLARDHGLIWRTTEETSIMIPGSQLGELAHRLTGVALGVLEQVPWVVPSVIAAIGFVFLFWLNKTRILRVVGYLFLIVAVLVTGWFAIALNGDLNIGSIPAGTPIDLLANLDPEKMDRVVPAIKLAIWTGKKLKHLDPNKPEDQKKSKELQDKLGQALLDASKSPDLVMDRGHYTAAALTPEEQQELIDLLRTF
jgi:hypothetical protein